MQPSARDNYLKTAVATASPEKLHLMLIDAAIRHVERAQQSREAGRPEEGLAEITHAQEVVNYLIGSMDHQSGSELVKKVTGVYLFVFRRLVDAGLNSDGQLLADALRILQIERETWRLVCEGQTPVHRLGPGAPHMPLIADLEAIPEGGFSLEV
jgi:flagellar secretion chaperone FliS